jgi:DNA-binding SARP family transcriptional activator
LPELRLSLLGSPRVEVGQYPLRLNRRKTLALLAYLAVTAQSQRRETLSALFWPDSPHPLTLSNLRRDLSILNATLGSDRLIYDRDDILLAAGSGFWCDVHLFEALQTGPAANDGQDGPIPSSLPRLIQAAALYRGDFLQGFSLPDCSEFEEWLFFQSERLRQSYVRVLKQLIGELLTFQNSGTIIPYALRWLAVEPLNEEIHRLVISLYLQAGQYSAALYQFERCTRLLRDELGLDPSPETRSLYKHILALQTRA